MQIEARAVGRREAAERKELAWPDAPEAPTAGDLIAHVVRSEVAGYNQRDGDRRLLRVLTEAQIADQARAGKIAAEVRDRAQPADEDRSIAVALEAFADGFFLMFVDDREIESVDEAVQVHGDLRVRFVRLVPLAGGSV